MGKRGPKPGDPRSVEAGRRGGNATKANHGMDHFRTIGTKGGNATLSTYGKEFYQSISRDALEK